jgi:CubicO group peptidase (beta-lactamase class C family)
MIQQPEETVLYSDVGFIVLGRVVERAAGEPMDSLLQRRVWGPLGMNSTRFQPGRGCHQCAPTLTLEDGTPFAGETNDPLARQLGGETGNAGLFSTAHDVARYAAMLAGGGALDGVRVIQESTVHEFTQPQPGAGTRDLGFETFCREGTVPDQKGCRTPYAFGHTGYTGTSLWVDPSRDIWVVLLSNRSYDPHASNDIQVVRRRLFDLATDQPSSVDGAAETTGSE